MQQEPKYCEGLGRRVATQTVSRFIHALEDEEEEQGGGAGAGGGALTPQSVARAQCLANILANYRCDISISSRFALLQFVCMPVVYSPTHILNRTRRDFVKGSSAEGEEQRVLRSVVRFAGRWAGRHGADEVMCKLWLSL
jgi:hypothetical protein